MTEGNIIQMPSEAKVDFEVRHLTPSSRAPAEPGVKASFSVYFPVPRMTIRGLRLILNRRGELSVSAMATRDDEVGQNRPAVTFSRPLRRRILAKAATAYEVKTGIDLHQARAA